MKISTDHWLEVEGSKDPKVEKQLIRGGETMEPPGKPRRLLVLHFTAGASAQSSVDFWNTPEAKGANAHIVIERDGSIIQCRPFNRTCGHAGKSHWRDPKHGGHLYTNVNDCSLGIEFANAGRTPVRWARERPGFELVRGLRPVNGGPPADWEKFYDPQIASGLLVAKLLVDRYNLDDLVGHLNISPDRREDPGPAFPMLRFREYCGFTGLPVTFKG